MDKVCMVCGDKALGYNFNAVTCESCKAFFRRNALSSKDFSCPFNDTCEITVVTRRFCQRCRLQKCFRIGMRKEYIMTEEDKLLKRKKVEQNRAKRKTRLSYTDIDEQVKKEPDPTDFWSQDTLMDLSPASINSDGAPGCQSAPSTTSNESMSPTSSSARQYPTQNQSNSLAMPFHATEPSISSSLKNPTSLITNSISSSTTGYNAMSFQSTRLEYPTKDSNTSDIVNFFLSHPSESNNYINHLMPCQKAAMEVITKIIQSQKDAMKMIGHLIGTPGDALIIISKIMNSPYQALNVFTKFMASPTDALEIIAKCVNSPSDVLQFIQQLMFTPDNAVEIVNKFMNSPAEAMKMLNDMVDITMVDSTTKVEGSDLSQLMMPADPMDTKPIDITSNDVVSDTLLCVKGAVNSTVRNLLESTHMESPRSNAKTCTEDSDFKMTNRPNTLESVINDAIKIEFNWNGKDSIINRELNDSETAKLNELIVAYKALLLPLDEDITPLVKRNDFSPKVFTLHKYF